MIRAAVRRGARSLELDRLELPAPRPGDVVVEVAACGVCATNLHGWAEPDAALRGSELAGVHGHEVSGVVTLTGDDARGIARGDRVCLEPALACSCGTCPPCLAAHPLSCRKRATLPIWGFADAIVVPARGVVLVPPGLDLELACLAEPLASAIHGIRHSSSASTGGRIDGLRVAVIGAGMIGLGATLAARHLGAGEVTVVARHAHQAHAAAALGADRILDDRAGVGTLIRRLRPQLVVEAAGGAGPTLETAFASVDRDGEVVVLGLFDGPRPLDVSSATLRNLRAFFAAAYGARDGVSDFSIALELLSCHSALARLITHRFPLDAVDDAFRVASDRAAGSLRVVVRP
jgi:(R,R)-butanediol dehydrogenase/meso-butanediol dehydrogenase/diacetyl reductase